MKKIVFILVVALVCSALSVCALAAGNGYIRFTGDCNVRTGPGLNYATMGAVSAGSQLEYGGDYSTDNRGVDWYMVEYQGGTGWVSSVYAYYQGDSSYNSSGNYQPSGNTSFPLEFVGSAWGEWKNLSGDKLNMRVKVTNTSSYATVKAFEMRMYAEDVWGDPIYGDGVYYYATTTKNVKPGETVYCDYLTLPQRSKIETVYARVSKVILTDGTVLENPSDNHFHWTIK